MSRVSAGRRSRAESTTGRRVGAVAATDARARGGLHLLGTVLAAVPRQHARGRTDGPLRLAPGDLRVAVREGREANLVLFCVDASGSMAARRRMGEVKAAILSLLLDAYQRRDTVGLVTFGGDAATLYRSIEQILALPDDTRLFTGHDYMPDGREPRWESTVGEQRERNPHLQNMDESAYTALRNKRDAELPLPALMLAALQINTRGGRLPTPENNGIAYLKIPVNAF